MNFREYDPAQDKEAAHRIWLETGWIEDNDKQKAAMDIFLSGGRTLLADLNGEPECLVASMPGSIRYLAEDLALSVVTAVTTSRIARKRGLAKRLTAHLIAADAAAGAQVSALGMFEQGFYNRLGYGTGGYEHWLSFDPAQLHIEKKARIPHRLTKHDWASMHTAMLTRQRAHGGVNLNPPQFTQGEAGFSSNSFGLGYYDGPDDELSHFFWARAKGEHGPYTILMMAYQNWDQFLELMAVLKNLGDQVRLVKMNEPGHIQIQDLIRKPFRHRQLTEKSSYESMNRATAYWQARICDLPGCLAQTHLPGEAVQFNLNLHDPITKHLDKDAPWRGIGGKYIITLGPKSQAKGGKDENLLTLNASVGAFTRMWLGVRPPSGLAVTDQLSGPPALMDRLDHLLHLAQPKPGWDF